MATSDQLNPLIEILLKSPATGLKAFNAILEPTPSDLTCAGFCYLALSEVKNARKMFEFAHAQFYEGAILGLAIAERLEHRLLEAMHTLRGLQFDRLNQYEQIIANRELGMLYLHNYQPKLAHTHLTRAWETASDNVSTYILLPNIALRFAHLEGQNGNWGTSLDWTTKGLLSALDDVRPYLLYRRALALIELKFDPSAIILELEQHESQKWNCLYIKARYAQAKGDHDFASNYFAVITENAPSEYKFFAYIKQITTKTPLESALRFRDYASTYASDKEAEIHLMLADSVILHLQGEQNAFRLAQTASLTFIDLNLNAHSRQAALIAKEIQPKSCKDSLDAYMEFRSSISLDIDIQMFSAITLPFIHKKLPQPVSPSDLANLHQYRAAWEAWCNGNPLQMTHLDRCAAAVSLARISHLEPNRDELLAYAKFLILYKKPLSAHAKAAYHEILRQCDLAAGKQIRDNLLAELTRFGYTLNLQLKESKFSIGMIDNAYGEYLLREVNMQPRRNFYEVECKLQRRFNKSIFALDFLVSPKQYHDCFLI